MLQIISLYSAVHPVTDLQISPNILVFAHRKLVESRTKDEKSQKKDGETDGVHDDWNEMKTKRREERRKGK